jgi:DNA-binding transcriptional LysR family regulator
VSRQIGHLEDRLGVRLLNRSKHGLSLTAEGREFSERCADVATKVSDAEAFVSSMGAHPQGVLRVIATVAFGKTQLLPIMPKFLRRFPDVEMSLELTDRPIDLASENIDVAIRFTEQIDDTSVVARKLAFNRRVICAAPSYLAEFGTPQSPKDLAQHNCLRLSTVTRWNEWNLDAALGEVSAPVKGNFEANSADGIYHAALAGVGIARLSTYLVGDDLEASRLIRILPEYSDGGSDIYAIYAEKRNLSPKVRAFIDYLVDWFGTVPPWERRTHNA